MLHMNSIEMQNYIRNVLENNGLIVDKSGIITYAQAAMNIYSEAVYLLRHGETYGTIENKFMSNKSKNSYICEKGVKDILNLGSLSKYCFDVVIVCCNIPRVLETASIVIIQNSNLRFIYKDDFYGIDNSGWEEKSCKDLTENDLEDFIEREIRHNIFAKSSNGGSWGEVLINCVRLINFINAKFTGKRVLLISQGSILQGLRILRHETSTPWEKYDAMKMFKFDKNFNSNYGQITCLYDNQLVSLKEG